MIPSEVIRRRELPHWDMPDATCFITTCLEGSIPAQGNLDLDNYRSELQRRPRPAGKTEPEWMRERWKLAFARTDGWLDNRPAARYLADPRLANVVVDAFYFFAGQRYDLLAFVVMPSHFHWVFRPLEAWVRGLRPGGRERTPRERIVHSINRYTARECNKLRGTGGTFWQHESYDHWVRDVDELERIIHYVENNPVKAGLVKEPSAWPYSSAWYRAGTGLELGCPLVRTRGERGQVGNVPPRE